MEWFAHLSWLINVKKKIFFQGNAVFDGELIFLWSLMLQAIEKFYLASSIIFAILHFKGRVPSCIVRFIMLPRWIVITWALFLRILAETDLFHKP